MSDARDKLPLVNLDRGIPEDADLPFARGGRTIFGHMVDMKKGPGLVVIGDEPGQWVEAGLW